jgi:hypothetical protein
LGAVADAQAGTALGVDPRLPAFHRIAYNAGTGELYLAFDAGLTAEQPAATLGIFRFHFDPKHSFKNNLAVSFSWTDSVVPFG